jgi:hypothetical protein
MKFPPLSLTIPVLILAGIISVVWGYFLGGLPKATEHAVVWLVVSLVVVLLGLWLRRSSRGEK